MWYFHEQTLCKISSCLRQKTFKVYEVVYSVRSLVGDIYTNSVILCIFINTNICIGYMCTYTLTYTNT